MSKSNFERFIRNVEYSKHCIHCEGLDLSIKDPKHHPSYEITTSCNLNCVYCYSRVALLNGTAPRPGYYGDENPRAITISQYGEPLLIGVKKVAYIIKRLREIFGDVRIDLQTNGTVDFSELNGLVDLAMVSLDSSNPDLYKRITGKNLFGIVIKNIEKSTDAGITTIVRSVYLPGINDDNIIELSKILKEIGVHEMFVQPCSVYNEFKDKLISMGFDMERAESIYDFLKVVYRCSLNLKTVIPGCMAVILKEILKQIDVNDLRFVKRRIIAIHPPRIKRNWRFTIEV